MCQLNVFQVFKRMDWIGARFGRGTANKVLPLLHALFWIRSQCRGTYHEDCGAAAPPFHMPGVSRHRPRQMEEGLL